MFQRTLGTCVFLGIVVICGVGCSPRADRTPSEQGSASAAQSSAGVPTVSVDGSSTVFPLTEAVAEEFQNAEKNRVHVTVGISGTGGGMKKFTRGEIDICDASRPILQQEIEAAKEKGIQYIELPICFDALTVVVHPQNDWVDFMTVDELKRIWEPDAQGKITRWNQIRPNWPDEPLALFGAGADSGTFDYFTEAVVGKAKACRGDYTASEDDNVLVQGVSGNKYALGFVPFAYYAENTKKMKAVAIDWEKDSLGPILPTLENVQQGIYNPLGRPLFIYVNVSSLSRPEVERFVTFYLQNAAELAKEVHYLPLPQSAYDLAMQRLKNRVTGTVFHGEAKVGVKIEDLLKLEEENK